MYKVIGSKMTRAFRVLWMLEEMGEAYEHIPTPPRSDVARAANPSGKVPSLEVDGQIITDSTAILTFLADKHGALTHPAGTIERAQQDALSNQILDEIESLIWLAARHSFILPEDLRVPDVKASLKAEYETNIARMADRYQGPFLMGDDLLIPDIVLQRCLRWANLAKFPGPGQVLAEYDARLEARPAVQRVTELP